MYWNNNVPDDHSCYLVGNQGIPPMESDRKRKEIRSRECPIVNSLALILLCTLGTGGKCPRTPRPKPI